MTHISSSLFDCEVWFFEFFSVLKNSGSQVFSMYSLTSLEVVDRKRFVWWINFSSITLKMFSMNQYKHIIHNKYFKQFLKNKKIDMYSVVSIKRTGCNKRTGWSKFFFSTWKKEQGGAKIFFSTWKKSTGWEKTSK